MIMITMPIIGCTWSGQNPNFSKNPKLAAPLFSWSCGTVQKLLRISTTQWPLYRKPCEDDDLRAWQCKLDLIQSQARWGARNLTSHPHRDHTPPSWMVNSPPLPFPLSCYKETDTVIQTQAHIYVEPQIHKHTKLPTEKNHKQQKYRTATKNSFSLN